MGDIASFLAAPFIMALTLVGIHVYMGIHVLEREIIFVDLAIAQIAALGATVGFTMGVNPEGTLSYLFSLGFVVLAAALFSLTRARNQRIPQEAIIGITYVIATAGAIIVADRAAGGAEHIKEILMGTLLWVTWDHIPLHAILYSTVGVLHYIFRNHFIKITDVYRTGEFTWKERFWDFLFYVSFGLVIVFSVRVAGVLLVFSFLVVPSAISSLFSRSWGSRLMLGWGIGFIVTIYGLWHSYKWDTPCGPIIVVLLGVLLVVLACVRRLISGRASPQPEG